MKARFTLSAILLFCLRAEAQVSVIDSASCMYLANYSHPYIDSTYKVCDTAVSLNFSIVVEATPGNIWQKERTYKFGNADIRDTTCAMITDTASGYPINNFSAFHFLLPETPQNLFSYYLKFWHKFDTDTLLDGCWLEFSSDSGASWLPADSLLTMTYEGIYGYCNLYSENNGGVYFDTIQGGRKAWNGRSNGWEYTALQFNYANPFKPHRSTQINAIRFVFQSDSINSNKPGWIINDISTGWVYINASGTNDLIAHNQLPIYPNPSASGIFHISYPDHYVKGKIGIYNIYGQKILEQPLSKRLDLSAFANGIYYYKTAFDGKSYSGVLSKN